MTDSPDAPRRPGAKPPPALPDVDSPPVEDVLDSVPSTEEVVRDARSADEIVRGQPSVDDILGRGRP